MYKKDFFSNQNSLIYWHKVGHIFGCWHVQMLKKNSRVQFTLTAKVYPNRKLWILMTVEKNVLTLTSPLEYKAPSTKLSVFSAVICRTLTEEIVAFSGEWKQRSGMYHLLAVKLKPNFRLNSESAPSGLPPLLMI